MGKPRMILLVRHAQSEGNKNRDIHQMIPDHRVKLTAEGQQQAEDAGRKLRSMLKPDDTIRIFTSPYRRTRETTEGILKSLTASDEQSGPSPFSRHQIKVYEEPRLREQDFGNFQPCSAEMERMWQERADYGHFFYRIPNGESAADAYDRISGFNESLWRNFGEEDFPSVCILVTHGLMTRVFLMKWYHWSVEYFEDLRNINHCEFVIMQRNRDNGKYELENKLRTWSELKRKAPNPSRTTENKEKTPSTAVPARRWGGCPDGCKHDHSVYPRRARKSVSNESTKPTSAPNENAYANPDITTQPDPHTDSLAIREKKRPKELNFSSLTPHLIAGGRDGGGSLSGAATPAEPYSDSDSPGSSFNSHGGPGSYFPTRAAAPVMVKTKKKKREKFRRRPTLEDIEKWAKQSGMGTGARADALGDEPSESESEEEEQEEGLTLQGRHGPLGNKGVEQASEKLRDLEEQEVRDKSVQGSVY